MGPRPAQCYPTSVEKSGGLIFDSRVTVPEITLQNQDGENSDRTGEKTYYTQANIPMMVPKVKF